MIETFAAQFSGLGEWLILLGPLFLITYFIPFFIATGRKHRFNIAIGLINLLLGWTVIGWFAAIIWAVNRDVRETDDDGFESPGPITFTNEPRFHERSFEPHFGEEGQSRKCAFCAESIRAEALVCRYCGRDVGATAAVAPQSRANIASLEENIQELQALLRDHEESVAHKSAQIEPATNYVPPQQEIAAEVVPLEVAHQLSGWKKFG